MSFHLGKPRLPSVEYYPNNIGNLTIGTPRSYSFLVYGRDERGIQVQILNALHKRGARIISQNGYSDEKNREFTLCVSCDLGEVSVTPDDLVIELRRMKQVRNAMAISMKNRLFDGFLFPLTMLITSRSVAVDSNIWFMIQDRLNSEDSRAGLRDVGRDFALEIVKQIREKMSSGFLEESIQENVRGYLKAAGWGSFTWQSETSFERVTVVDPPIYSGKAVGNYFLHGLAAGLLEAFRKKKFSLAEEVYNQDTRSLTLMLSEKRIEVKRIEDKKISRSLEVKALEEVEKVIRSVELDEMELENPPPTTPRQKEESKPVVLVQQSGVEITQDVSTPPIPAVVAPPAPVPVPAPVIAAPPAPPPKIEAPQAVEAKSIAEVEQPKPETIIAKTTPVLEAPATPEVKPPIEEKKPLRVIEIKGIKEKEDSEDEEEDDFVNDLWFEEAIQEE
jgi:hypothetical protein